ncbi:hypothetical protein AAVH_14742 [Aphelenchoides avenae]|nr:hypothetical protein AAVH_14742 [Aphelenchus avenae]
MRHAGAVGFLCAGVFFLASRCASEPNGHACRRKLRRHWRDICVSFNCALPDEMHDVHPDWLSVCNNAAIREQCCESTTEQPAAELPSLPLRDIGPMFLLPEELAESIEDPRTRVVPMPFTRPAGLQISR